jgi:hypothetical protein
MEVGPWLPPSLPITREEELVIKGLEVCSMVTPTPCPTSWTRGHLELRSIGRRGGDAVTHRRAAVTHRRACVREWALAPPV